MACELSIFPTATLRSAILSLRPKIMIADMNQDERGSLFCLKKADWLIGSLLCGVAALGASEVALGHSWEALVPLAFSMVLLLVAGVFGMRAGIVGTFLATLVFADFLFSPVGSMRVASDTARSNLGWMLLIGLAFSLLFAPPTSGFRRH